MAESKTPWEQASEWFGRTIAIVMVMVAPGAGGAWVDGRLGTNFVTALGFVLGMALAIVLLMIFTRIKPVENDGDIMKSRSTGSPSGLASIPKTTRQPPTGKPSDSPLPDVPGAEVLEPRRDE